MQTNQISASMWLIGVVGVSLLALVVAVLIARWVLARDTGTDAMRAISDAIKEGAEAFLSRQYRTIGVLSIALAVLIFLMYAFVRTLNHEEVAQHLTAVGLATSTVVSFILGALCSGIAGYVGMWIAIRTNIRTASAARTSLNAALQIALRGGAVSGIFVVAMSLLGGRRPVRRSWASHPAHRGDADPVHDRRLRLRRLLRRPRRAARRRHLHQGC